MEERKRSLVREKYVRALELSMISNFGNLETKYVIWQNRRKLVNMDKTRLRKSAHKLIPIMKQKKKPKGNSYSFQLYTQLVLVV